MKLKLFLTETISVSMVITMFAILHGRHASSSFIWMYLMSVQEYTFSDINEITVCGPFRQLPSHVM